jgi:hypothetical protein
MFLCTIENFFQNGGAKIPSREAPIVAAANSMKKPLMARTISTPNGPKFVAPERTDQLIGPGEL